MIYTAVQRLIEYGIRTSLINKEDEYVIRNGLMDLLGLTDWHDCELSEETAVIDDILAPIVDYACEQGIIPDTSSSRDLFDTKIMGLLTPMPREIIANFRNRYENDPADATDWYYRCSQNLNYVRAGRIAKDLRWTHDTDYGTLDITINRSKPEKDPRDIALARKQKSANYPMCQLCAENAGFAGTVNHPARQNLRPIPITVAGTDWQMQYSPYSYYNEHCIFFNAKHVPMKIDAAVFGKLFDIIDYLPHYMVGSNADLPIVGGSILSHEHFQGGRYTFAMNRAPIETEFEIPGYPNVKAGTVKWPMSVIRLVSEDKDELARCSNLILENWRTYSDDSVMVYAETNGTPHNTITPIAHKDGKKYVCELVLRNNYTTEERPLGVFHPAPELHHIKKENIGLIEVMGLAVLPARLANDLEVMSGMLAKGQDIRSIPELEQHADWVDELLAKHPELNAENVRYILEQEVGEVFLHVLEDAGVFKRTAEGQAAFARFISVLNSIS
jgi:UDPglucose--hexose-1-phosphate uridylyltransferase